MTVLTTEALKTVRHLYKLVWKWDKTGGILGEKIGNGPFRQP